MIRLILLGLVSGMFFSSTFILNRAMSLEGGHWVWSGCLRYLYMIGFLMIALPIFQGKAAAKELWSLYIRHWVFWTLAGSIGFGGFYALICFSADHAPGWVIATTWQLTILASLIVLMGFGRTFPLRIWGFSLLVFLGVLMVNLTQAAQTDLKQLIMGGLPVLVAAFCYPIGNQLVWEAQAGNRRLPRVQSPCLENPFNKVLLLSVGSLPFWVILVLIVAPPAPSAGQLTSTALVAVFSGIIATSLFLFARSRATTAAELAAVDATQSSEVIFAIAGEIVFLHAPIPGLAAVAGVVLMCVGLFLFVRYQQL